MGKMGSLYESFKDDLFFNGEKKVLDRELKKTVLIRASNERLMSLIAEDTNLGE